MPCALSVCLAWCCWASLSTAELHPASYEAAYWQCLCRWELEELKKDLDEDIAKLGVEIKDAELQRLSATDPVVAARWEGERRQAAARQERTRQQRAAILRILLDFPGWHSSLPVRSMHAFLNRIALSGEILQIGSLMGGTSGLCQLATTASRPIQSAWLHSSLHPCFGLPLCCTFSAIGIACRRGRTATIDLTPRPCYRM